MLTEAIAAVRAGDHTRARDLLTRLLKIDSANPEYWLWMSSVVESERERIYCLQSVLRYDPTNRAALRGLTILNAHTPSADEIATALKIPSRKISPPSRISPTGLPIGNAWKLIAGAAIILIGIIAVTRILMQPRSTAPAPTLPPPSPTPSSTPIPPTATPIPIEDVLLRTPIPTELAGTPIAVILSFSPTPTPFVGVTPVTRYEAYTSAVHALETGNYAGCISLLDQVIDLEPNLADAYYLRGEAFRLLGKYDDAEQAYQQALERNPIMAAAYLGLGRIQIEEDPHSLPDSINLAITYDSRLLPAYIYKADILSWNQDWMALADTAQSAMNAGVSTPSLYIHLGQAQYHLANYEKALESLMHGTAYDPTILEAYALLGEVLFELGRYQEALSPLQTYLVFQGEDPLAWSYLGRAYYASEDFDSSEAALRQAIRLNDRDRDAFLLLGLIHVEMGMYKDAIVDLQQAKALGVDSDELELAIAVTYYNLEEFDSALDTVQQIIETCLDTERLVSAYSLQAQIFEEQDPSLLEEALSSWRSILELEGVSEEARLNAEEEITRIEDLLTTPTVTPTSETLEQ
jgi:tetratricopeptide (TPR) repeat protein